MQAPSTLKVLAMNDGNEPKKTGRAKGGEARAAKLSPERRSEIARKAAVARYGLKATHKGNLKEDFGFDVECYVLNDATKSAAISLRGLGAALGFSSGGGGRLPRFLDGAKIAPYVGLDIRQKLENPLVFQSPSPVSAKTYGYDVTLLIDLCKVIIKAETEGALLKRHAPIVQQAHIILGASAKAGIKYLVYALAGYRPETEEVIAAFKLYVQEEAKKYEQEFPNELYAQWHRLYQIPMPQRGKSWHLMHLTVRHIYYPLAKSNGKILELMRALKASDGDRKKKLFQFLNDVGARALRMHIGRVYEMAESSATKQEYDAKIVARFGGQQELELVVPNEQGTAS